MDKQELLDLKKDIDEAKNKSSEAKGRLSAIIEEFKKKWGVKTIKEAEEKMEQLQDELQDMQEELDNRLEKLQEDYNL